jgi:hypothetical protein
MTNRAKKSAIKGKVVTPEPIIIPIALTGRMITNQEYSDLYNCLLKIGGATLKKNVGDKQEVLVLRAWTGQQQAIHVRNQRKMKEHFSELQAFEEIHKQSRTQIFNQYEELKAIEHRSEKDKLMLEDLLVQINQLNSDRETLFNTPVDFPVLETINYSEIKDFEIFGAPNLNLFWKELVDLAK